MGVALLTESARNAGPALPSPADPLLRPVPGCYHL